MDPAIVFVPGFMQRGDAWAEVARRLAQRYLTRLVDPLTATYEGRVAEILAAAPPGSVGVGYSLGGRLLLHAALREPDRFGALALLGVHAGIEDAGARAARRQADEALAAWIAAAPIDQVVARWEANPVFASQGSELVARQRPGRLAQVPAELAELLRSAGQGALPPVWDRLSELRRPVLLLAGALDAPYAAAAERMAARLPLGVARLVPGVGHAAHLERPDAVIALLALFLEEHGPELVRIEPHA